MKKKTRTTKEEAQNELNLHSNEEVEENEPQVKPCKARGSSDLGNRYKFAHKNVYNNLPEWKKPVIDNNEYNDRIYEEFVKEVIQEAEQIKVE
jgi:hypothetical protein